MYLSWAPLLLLTGCLAQGVAMKLSIRSFLGSLAAVAFVAMAPITPAQAGACPAGTTCTFHLTNTNLIGVTSDIEVLINNFTDPLHTQITVNFLSSNVTNTPLGIDQFGFDSALAVSTQAPGFNSASCP